jgi:hypothetical protein
MVAPANCSAGETCFVILHYRQVQRRTREWPLGRKSEFRTRWQSDWLLAVELGGATVIQENYCHSGIVLAPLFASVAVVWAGILFHTSHESTPAPANGVQPAAISGTVSNSALKRNRLVGPYGTIEHAKSAPAAEGKRATKIPVGCDAAFSKLIKSNNFASRCVTSIQLDAKFA